MNALSPMLLSAGGRILLHETALLLLAWLANGLLYACHPRWRLIVWRSTLVLCCLLPAELLFPSVGIRIYVPAEPSAEVKPAISEVSGPASLIPPVASVASTAAPRIAVAAAPFAQAATYPWEGVLSLFWMLGAVMLGLRLLRLQLRLNRLRRKAIQPETELLRLAECVRIRLALPRPVAIRISNEVSTPFVCGLWPPVMILPDQLLKTMGAAETSALLNHEMSHMRSHDLAWCIGWRWMQSLAWFHPLVWKAPAAHNLACEQEADRLASRQWPDRSDYPRLLANLTLQVYALSSVETELTLNGASQIAKRLQLLRGAGFQPWRAWHSLAGAGLASALALAAAGWGFSVARAAEGTTSADAKDIEMQRYASTEWHFAIDIPKSWNAFPPVSTNSPYEVIRFESGEGLLHGLIVFRNPVDPRRSMDDLVSSIQRTLEKSGFSHFSKGHILIGSKEAATLDFEKPMDNGILYCRHYVISEGTYGYTLGFGTTNQSEISGLYDRMAKSFRTGTDEEDAAAQPIPSVISGLETGFYRASMTPGPGLRPMFRTGDSAKGKGAPTVYVAPEPDLRVSDLRAVSMSPDGINIDLAVGAQQRLAKLTGDRPQDGHVGYEAVIIDGAVVAVPHFAREINMSSFTIRGLTDSVLAGRLAREIDDAKQSNPPSTN